MLQAAGIDDVEIVPRQWYDSEAFDWNFEAIIRGSCECVLFNNPSRSMRAWQKISGWMIVNKTEEPITIDH